MANHTKTVTITDAEQKLLWDIIVDDGDNAGVDAWVQTIVDEKINACWNRMRTNWTKILMNDASYTDDIPSNQAAFVALVIARDDYKNRKVVDDAEQAALDG
jgi:hypothetical protein